MIGHGRPASLAMALARAALIVCAFLRSNAFAQNVAPPDPIQLRVTWGGGDPTRWTGRIAVDEGTLADLKLVESEPDAVGSIWLDNGQLRVQSLNAHKADSIEFSAKSGQNSKLQIELAPEGKVSPSQLEVPLADLPRHPYQVRLDDHGNTVEVQIVSPPPIKIETKGEQPIYAPGEQCSFEMSPALPNLSPGTDLVIQTTMTPLSPACRNEPPWSDSKRLAVPINGHPTITLDVPLPKTEGVYKIHVSVSRPSGFDKLWTAPTRLTVSSRLAERSFQVVVLDQRPAAVTALARWDSVLEIDPTNPRWFERLPTWTQLRRIPGLNHGALGNTYAQVKDLPLGRFVELPPMPPVGDPHWQAYSLPLEAVSVPHMLEIDYPADAEQHFGISIVEPGANGFVSGVNRDAGIYVEGLGRSEATQKQTHRLVFWPRTQAPLLVITNLHSSAAAHFGPIRVYKRSTSKLSAGIASDASSQKRLITAYLAGPAVAETFGAAKSNDASAANSAGADGADDSETAYEGAVRLADYLRFSGYNSAIVNAQFGRRPISGTKAPLEIDGTELMLRVCDREGIRLLPAIDFTTPLASLETLRRKSDARTSGLEWVGRDGRTWLQTYGTHHGLAPYYNLLDTRVQQAILQTVQEHIRRYDQHRAFTGLAIQLSSTGYAQLAPPDWGLDDATYARFAQDNDFSDDAAGEDRFEARFKLVSGIQAVAWRTWRARQVSQFYARLTALVRANGDRRLVLTTENVFADPQLAELMRPNLNAHSAGERLIQTLVDVGIDREYLERIPGLVLCPTRYVEPTTLLPDCATDLELNEAFTLWRRPTTLVQSRGASLYHRPIRQRLASFELAGRPWRVAGEMQMVCQPVPQGFAVRQPYVEALADHDPAMIIDGGERLPLGQEDVLRDLRAAIAQLPTSAEVFEIAKQPVTVRTYGEQNAVTIVVMNTSPWRCDSIVTVDVPQATVMNRITSSSADATASNSAAISAGRFSWKNALEPYEVRVVRIPIGGPRVVDIQATNTNAKAELAAKLNDLNNRDLTAKSDYPVLPNPSFEPVVVPGQSAGWRLAPGSKATIELDSKNPQDGKYCLHIRSDGPPAVLESDAIALPPTGQLAMTVYARGQNLARGTDLASATELRLIVEADRDGLPPYKRSARVPNDELQRTNDQWGQAFAIYIPNLPLRSRGQMRIAFELTGAGEVWLDNVKLSSVILNDNTQAENLRLTKQIYAAKSAFEAGQISDCVKNVDSYWPRFILAYRPPYQPKVAERVVPKPAASPPQANEGQDSSPGFSDGLKRFLKITR